MHRFEASLILRTEAGSFETLPGRLTPENSAHVQYAAPAFKDNEPAQ